MEGAGTVLGQESSSQWQQQPRLAPGKVQKASPSGFPFRNLTSLQAISIQDPLKCKTPAGRLRRNLLVRDETLWGHCRPYLQVTGLCTIETKSHLSSDSSLSTHG